MPEGKKEKWQEQVEAIIRKQFKSDQVPQMARNLIDGAEAVEVPSGEAGKVVALLLKAISQDLYPLAATYASFQLGVAWERYDRENDAR